LKRVHVLILPLAWLLCTASAFAGQATSEPSPPDTQRPPARMTKPAPVKATPSPALERWFDLQTATFATRYRMIETSVGVVSTNQMQGQVALKGRVKFDSRARFTLNAFVGTGNSFTGSWNTTGVGTGELSTNLYLKQIYLAASPVKGFDAEWGGLGIARGDGTEITTYDNDGYIVGERLSIRRPKDLYVDEISATVGYLGDTSTVSFTKRYQRLDDVNYRQFLVARKFGPQVSLSADYTRLQGVGTLRAAVTVRAKFVKAVDLIRFEQYRRLGTTAAWGFGAYAEKAVTRKVTVGGGYADIDLKYGGLNADRFNKGKRLYATGAVKLSKEFGVSMFFGRAVGNSVTIVNQTRFDLLFTYNAVASLQKAGFFAARPAGR